MIFRNDLDFYCPWPLFGVKLGQQWREIRANTVTLHPTAKGTLIYADENPSFDPDCTTVLAGFEFGEQDFPNKFRIIWEEASEQFNFDCNTGSTSDPTWKTSFYIDCDSDQIIFLDRVNFAGSSNVRDITIADGIRALIGQGRFSINENDFYLDIDSSGDPKINLLGGSDTDSITITDGIHSLTSNNAKFSVNEDNFYLDTDSEGNPKLNLIGGDDTNTITITDGVHTLTSNSAKFSVNEDHFYLDKDSEGNPKLNFVKPNNVSKSGHFLSVPQETIVLDEFAPSAYSIEFFAGKTETGTGKVTIKIDDSPVTGLVNLGISSSQIVEFATGSNTVSRGDRLTMHMNDFYASSFSWTLGAFE